VLKSYSGIDVQEFEGAGAAGGIGAGLLALCKAELVSGFNMLSDITNLSHAIASSDLIISGEGKIDASSFQGKVVGGISKLAEEWNKPLVLVCGSVDIETYNLRQQHIPIFSMMTYARDLDDAIANAEEYLVKCCELMAEYIRGKWMV
ncbi:MAG: glycerate kinase, partial [Saprospiraceae bacterium]|nr:glycerate kinase [Saprospiraceae bacterium]